MGYDLSLPEELRKNQCIVEWFWESQSKRVKAPYAKYIGLFDAVPEYGEARETLSETGSTTIQG